MRQWLIENGFQGKDGQKVPEMSEEFVSQVSERYIELYESISGDKFQRADLQNVNKRIEDNIKNFLATL